VKRLGDLATNSSPEPALCGVGRAREPCRSLLGEKEKDIVDCGRDGVVVVGCNVEDVSDSLANRAWFAVKGEGVADVVSRGGGVGNEGIVLLVLLVCWKLSNVESFWSG
jgi:hypothetical protein